jgi:hypothetical protein
MQENARNQNKFLIWNRQVATFNFTPSRITSDLALMHPVHTAPSTALLRLGCYWPCRQASTTIPSRTPRRSKVANQITRSGTQPPIWLKSRPVQHLSLAPNSWILNKPCLPPLIHARLQVSQQWTSVIHQIYTAPCPRPLHWWTHSLKIKYRLVTFSGRQPMVR